MFHFTRFVSAYIFCYVETVLSMIDWNNCIRFQESICCNKCIIKQCGKILTGSLSHWPANSFTVKNVKETGFQKRSNSFFDSLLSLPKSRIDFILCFLLNARKNPILKAEVVAIFLYKTMKISMSIYRYVIAPAFLHSLITGGRCFSRFIHLARLNLTRLVIKKWLCLVHPFITYWIYDHSIHFPSRRWDT